MEDLYLHAVIIKKPISLPLARFRSQKFIKDKHRTFFRETEDSFRFRNIPKGHFKDFVSKQIDEDTTLILGHLNEKWSGKIGETSMESK